MMNTFAEIAGQPSHSDIGMMIHRALNPADLWNCDSPMVTEVADGNAIVHWSGKSWRYPYTVDAGGGAVTLGAPVPARLTWRDVESLTAREPGGSVLGCELRGLRFAEGVDLVDIEVCRDGQWNHPSFGPIEITPDVRASFIANFKSNVRLVGELPLDYDHEQGPASGWIVGLFSRGESLFASVRFTATAREQITRGEYRFFSPEWHPDWTDPAGVKHGPTLFGGGITNRPFFRELAPLPCRENGASPSNRDGDTGAEPQRETGMVETPAPAAQTGTETPATITAAEAQRLQDRITAIETENASLRAAEERRGLEATLQGLSFSEGRVRLAPAGRNGLADALMTLTKPQRDAVVASVKSLQFVELGERGYVAPEADGSGLTEAEEANVRAMSERTGQKFDELKAVFLETKASRKA